MEYAIQELEKRSKNYKQDYHLRDYATEISNASIFLMERKYVEVSSEVIYELLDCLYCVDRSLEQGTKEMTDWRKRQLKRKEDLEQAIDFFRPKNYKIRDLKGSFDINKNEERKQWEFTPNERVNSTSYTVAFYEADNEEDAWITLYMAVQKSNEFNFKETNKQH